MSMSRGLGRGLQLCKAMRSSEEAGFAATSSALQHFRCAGTAPEFFGKPSPYSPGTKFLGTPPDQQERLKRRPVSPHVFEIDGKSFHYKMPVNAISSIVNRATGVALTTAMGGAGAFALVGDLPAAIDSFQASFPLLVYPVRAAIVFPLVYHYLGGIRHVIWEKHTMGKQAEKKSYLENEAVDKSSKLMFATSLLATLGLTVYP